MKKVIKDEIAKTFTCSYDQKEDRLRLILNYQDPITRVDLWITRSFLLRLLPLLSKFGSSQNEMSLASDNMANEPQQIPPSTPTDESMLLLTQREPIILEQVDFGKSNGVVNIVFSSPLIGKYTASLQTQEIDTLANLLIKTAPTYDWGIGPWWV
jgi:hypothetical protein